MLTAIDRKRELATWIAENRFNPAKTSLFTVNNPALFDGPEGLALTFALPPAVNQALVGKFIAKPQVREMMERYPYLIFAV